MPERADEPPFDSELEWVAAIEDESDRDAVRAVLRRKRWREQWPDVQEQFRGW